MYFESQVKRNRRISWALVMVSDVVVAGIATAILKQPLAIGALIFLGLQVLGIVSMMVRSVTDWLYYRAIGKNFGVQFYRSAFQQAGFPPAGPVERSWEGYLDQVMGNEANPIKTRLTAATFFGFLTGSKQNLGIFGNVRLESILEGAIAAYSTGEGRSAAS